MKQDNLESISNITQGPLPEASRPNSGIISDMLKLISGTTIAQALGILVAPLLTRLYDPEAFGVFALFTSITSIIGVVVCFRYELAIMLPEKDGDASNLFGASLLITIISSILSVILVWSGGNYFIQILRAPDLKPYLWLIPVIVFITGLYLALNYWNTRSKMFGRLSVTRVNNSIVTSGVQLGAGYGGLASPFGLISAYTIGLFVSTLVLAWQTWFDYSSTFFNNIHWKGIWSGIKRYRKFPLYDSWGALLNSISWQLPAFLLTAFFSSTITGYYSLANRLLGLPMGLIGAALAQVFFQRAAEAKSNGTLSNLTEEIFHRLVSFGMFPLLVVTILGREIFTILFGSNWAEAGVYAQILSVWTFFWFISSPMSTLFSVLERQGLFLIINLSIFLTRLIALALGGYLGDARLALLFFAVSGVAVYGYESLIIMRASAVSMKTTFRTLFKYLLFSIPMISILIALKWLRITPFILVIIGSGFIGLYILFVLSTETQRLKQAWLSFKSFATLLSYRIKEARK